MGYNFVFSRGRCHLLQGLKQGYPLYSQYGCRLGYHQSETWLVESTTSPTLRSKCHDRDLNLHSADRTPELESGALNRRPLGAINRYKKLNYQYLRSSVSTYLKIFVVLLHRTLVYMDLWRLESRHLCEAEVGISEQLPCQPKERLLKVVVTLGADVVILRAKCSMINQL